MLSLYFEVIYEIVGKLRTPILVGIHQDKQGFKGLDMRLSKSSLYTAKRRFFVKKVS